MKWIKALFAGLGLFVSTVSADQRFQPYDLGLSILIPDGWVLERDDATENYRLYSLYDTTVRDTSMVHSTTMQFEVYSGIKGSGASAISTRAWINEEAMNQEYFLEGQCFSSLFSSDTMLIDGYYGRYILGQAASCDANSSVLLGNLETRYTRVTANGDIGWVMSFAGDTVDVDTANPTYLGILDNIVTDRSFTSLPYVGTKARPSAAASRKVVAEGYGLRLNIGASARPLVEVLDLQGRKLSGRLQPGARGSWLWRPDGPVGGMVAIRIESGSSVWVDRAVLSR